MAHMAYCPVASSPSYGACVCSETSPARCPGDEDRQSTYAQAVDARLTETEQEFLLLADRGTASFQGQEKKVSDWGGTEVTWPLFGPTAKRPRSPSGYIFEWCNPSFRISLRWSWRFVDPV